MDFVSEIAKNGVLGLLLAYFIWDNRQLRKENKELYEKSIQDAKDNIKSVIDPMNSWTDALNEQKAAFTSMIFGKGRKK